MRLRIKFHNGFLPLRNLPRKKVAEKEGTHARRVAAVRRRSLVNCLSALSAVPSLSCFYLQRREQSEGGGHSASLFTVRSSLLLPDRPHFIFPSRRRAAAASPVSLKLFFPFGVDFDDSNYVASGLDGGGRGREGERGPCRGGELYHSLSPLLPAAEKKTCL